MQPEATGGDIAVLNDALTLEYLQHAFYSGAQASGTVTDPQLAAFLACAVRDEAAHVAYLKQSLGRHAVAQPTFDFRGAYANEATFAATAQVLENLGVHAYTGQAANLTSPAYRLAILSIVSVEARHAGAIGLHNAARDILDTAGAFDTGYTAARVRKILTSTRFIVG